MLNERDFDFIKHKPVRKMPVDVMDGYLNPMTIGAAIIMSKHFITKDNPLAYGYVTQIYDTIFSAVSENTQDTPILIREIDSSVRESLNVSVEDKYLTLLYKALLWAQY